MAGLLSLLAHPTNQAILEVLAVEPNYPRRVAALLGLPETDAARRLRRMEKAGLLEARWERAGANVRMYRLATERVEVRLGRQGVTVRLTDQEPPPAHGVAPRIPDAAGFLGRADERALLAGEAHVVLVLGMAGIGKTALLAAHAHAAARPVFYAPFRGIESLGWIANQIALFLAREGDPTLLDTLPGLDAAGIADATLQAMQGADAEFILDGVDRVDDEVVARFVADAVTRSFTGRLLVASREWVAHDPSRPGLAVVRLTGLDDASVRRFLAEHGLKVKEALLPRIRDEVGGHPMALALFAVAAQRDGVEALLDRVPEEDLDAWLLEELEGRLSDDERAALMHASVFRTPFTAQDLHAVSRRRLEGTLSRLRRRLLVTESDRHFILPEVVQNYFYARLADAALLHGRAAAHFAERGTVVGRLEAMHHYLRAGQRDEVLKLLQKDLDVHDFAFVDAGYTALYLDMLRLFTRSEVASPRDWGLIQDELGDIHTHRGASAKAKEHYQAAHQAFTEAGDQERAADAERKLA